jgi:hypothetical protein
MLFLTNFAKFPVFPAFAKRTMAVLAATVLAYQTYKGYKSYQTCKLHNEKQKRLKEEQEAAFENRYFKEYDQMNDDPDAPVPSANSHVRETTPQGDVIMTYDMERALFCYYCDKRTVQFKYLEPVARKYVIEHGCKRLYIDFRKEMSKANERATNPPIAPPTVFAQLKKYSNGNTGNGNNGNGNNGNGNNGNRTPNLSKINEFIKNKGLNVSASASASASSNVLKEQVTHYLYCGRLDEFIDAASESSPVNETHDFNIIKPIDYASYKKMNVGDVL